MTDTSDDVVDQVLPTATSAPVSFRRNGKLFSCEPCRKGKLRCDHVSPVCGRCSKRGRPEQCIYHPAPLTKPRTSSDGPIRRTSSNGAVAKVATHLSRPSLQANGSNKTHWSSSSTTTSVTTSLQRQSGSPMTGSLTNPTSTGATTTSGGSCITTESCTSYRDSRRGFFGPTHYSAVFTEASGGMDFDDDDCLSEHDDSSPIPPEKIAQGAEVLTILRDMPLFLKFTSLWFDFYGGLIILQPAFKIWCDDLWAEFGSVLIESNPAKLHRLSELIFRNTRRPFKTHGGMSAVEWSKAATGRNIRWEVIGIILSLVGLISTNLNEWDAIFDEMRAAIIDRGTFGERMRMISERCLWFCYDCEVLNDMYMCFMYQDLVLVHSMKGEAHYIGWQRTGELLDALVAMGVHQGNRVDAETPFFLAELRKKIFVACYSRDKEMACFLGRPPRLSYRYCKLDMPRDMSDEELFLEGAELDAALSQLDDRGWNARGRLSRLTWTRVWFQECLVREEILELALGSEEVDINDRAKVLKQKLDHVHSTLPDCIQISPSEALDPDSPVWNMSQGVPTYADRMLKQVNALYILCISTGMMLTEFLLERAVVNRTKGDTRALIPISRKMLGTVLLAQSRRDLSREFRGDIVYMLASYGLPSAGVLAVELLKQEQTRQARQYASDLLPKSEIVQSLSVFISALASVSPGEGNYTICNQGRRALKRVLDQILDPSAAPTARLAADQVSYDDASLYFPTGNDAEFLDWLDNIAWDKAFMPSTVPP